MKDLERDTQCVYVVDWKTERRVLKMLPDCVTNACLKYSSLSPDSCKHAKTAFFFCPSESRLSLDDL